jgi:glycosyltransferase involved in cell wall biosynthesis
VSRGHEVHVITAEQTAVRAPGRWRYSVEAGIHVHWVAVSYANEMRFTRRLLAFIVFAVLSSWKAVSIRCDLLFATSTPLTIAIPALVASWLRRTPFVFEVRDMWPDVPIAIGAIKSRTAIWLARRLEAAAYARASHIVALAPGMRDDIVAKGIPLSKVSVIPNGCDVDVFSSVLPHKVREIRDSRAWLGDRPLVLFAGAIGQVNGVDYLARLAGAVNVIDPEVRFVCIGRGKERELVQRIAREQGVLNQSFFMMEPIKKADLANWIAAADVIVALFSGPRVVWKDAVQNKFFDALAAGRPIACNFMGWQSELAIEAGVGIVLDPLDLDRAARDLVQCIADTDWRATAHLKALSLARGPFSRDSLATELERVLIAVAAASARPH